VRRSARISRRTLVTAAADDLHAIALARGKTHSGHSAISPLDHEARTLFPPSGVVDYSSITAAPITADATCRRPHNRATPASECAVIAPAAAVPCSCEAVLAIRLRLRCLRLS